MNTGDLEVETAAATLETPEDGASPPSTETNGDAPAAAAEGDAPAKKKLNLDVQITDIGPCKKRIKVVVSQTDVEDQFKKSLGDLTKDAAVPGFRKGHAPKKLVQRRFRKQVEGQVKTGLILACLEQLDTDHNINAISQPNFDIEAIEVPEGAPMVFELEVEVRPDFETPDYKGLTVERPVKEFTDADVDRQLQVFRESYAKLEPKPEGEGAALGDVLTVSLSFFDGDAQIGQTRKIDVRLEPELRLHDGHILGFGEALAGVRPGETRNADVKIGLSSPSRALRGKTIRAEFQVEQVRFHKLPAMTPSFLSDLGFNDEKDLRGALLAILKERFESMQRTEIRRSIVDQLLGRTTIQLPKDLVSRQEKATLQRMVFDLQQSGRDQQEIRAHEAELRGNAHEATQRSLREFFVLAQIAKVEEIKFEEADLDAEIQMMALKSGESLRRIRARVEREGLADSIATQGLERRTIERILTFAVMKDVPLAETRSVETIADTAGVPSAEPEPEAEPAAESSGESEPAAEPGQS